MSNVKEYSYTQHLQLFSHGNVIVRIALFENHAILCRKHYCTHRALRFYRLKCHGQFLSYKISFVAG